MGITTAVRVRASGLASMPSAEGAAAPCCCVTASVGADSAYFTSSGEDHINHPDTAATTAVAPAAPPTHRARTTAAVVPPAAPRRAACMRFQSPFTSGSCSLKALRMRSSKSSDPMFRRVNRSVMYPLKRVRPFAGCGELLPNSTSKSPLRCRDARRFPRGSDLRRRTN